MTFRRQRRQQGAAIVLALFCVVLITILLIAVLRLVRNDLITSKNFSQGALARLYAESALNVVMGNIQQATQTSGQAWISQPGLIRTFDTTGAAVNAYKLYSSQTNIIVGTFNPLDGSGNPVDAPLTWQTTDGPNVYADINEPIITDNVPFYPVLNPGALAYSTPIQGFSAIGTGTYVNAQGNNVVNPVTGQNIQTLPMPVKWIYFFKDGSQATAKPVAGNLNQVSFVDSTGTALVSSPTNPPIARVAYWTDDESCKVNINTAGGGAFWDTPVANTFPSALAGKNVAQATPRSNITSSTSIYESDLALYQPSQQEFQRYPGHPATTDLLPILAGPILNAHSGYTTNQIRETIYSSITPRYVGGSSSSQEGVQPGTAVLASSPNRLYESVDELLYSPVFTPSPTPGMRQENTDIEASSAVRRATVDALRFFLTAHSRAPEVNLFNQPRVVTWPVYASGATYYAATSPYSTGTSTLELSHLTAFDQLIAFCGTVGQSPSKPMPFFFIRSQPLSPTTDWKTQNKNVYGYLQSLTSQNIPGFGGNFVAKWPSPGGGVASDRDQILTEIFDYIRCLNLQDAELAANKSYTPQVTVNNAQASGEVIPIEPPSGTVGFGTKGFGRIPTISELAINFVADYNASFSAAPYYYNQYYPKTQVEVGIFPELYCPMAGNSSLQVNMQAVVSNININLSQGGTTIPVTFPQSTYTLVATGLDPSASGTRLNGEWAGTQGGFMGLDPLLQNNNAPPPFPPSPATVLPVSNKVTLTGSNAYDGTQQSFPGATFTIKAGSSIQVDLQAPWSNYGNGIGLSPSTSTYQHFIFKFDKDTTFYVPGPCQTGADSRRKEAIDVNPHRFIFNTGNNGQDQTKEGDVVVGLVAAGKNTSLAGAVDVQNDLRFVSASLSTANAARYFAINPLAFPAGGGTGLAQSIFAHSLKNSFSQAYAISSGGGYTSTFGGVSHFGNLVKGLGAFTNPGYNTPAHGPGWLTNPKVAAGIDGVTLTDTTSTLMPGDWDNGPSLIDDGPFLNKPDEGCYTGSTVGGNPTDIPYIGNDFASQYFNPITPTLFTPNRQMPSPVMFGSLPTGIERGLRWQTLLFRPVLANLPGGLNHPGTASPPDHLLLDLFWMPVVQPYAISEPFSTAGKINMNYQIVPFTNITRKSGIIAALAGSQITALNPSLPANDAYGGTLISRYKCGGFAVDTNNGNLPPGMPDTSLRYAIDPTETLAFFDDRFANNKPFISASEICTVPLVPVGISTGTTTSAITSDLNNFWAANNLTGDNSLERPYTTLYPRLTTKSNTFTVHVRTQMLNVGQTNWTGTLDLTSGAHIMGEYRGSYVIERYLDPNNQTVKDYSGTTPLGPYLMRVIETNQYTR